MSEVTSRETPQSAQSAQQPQPGRYAGFQTDGKITAEKALGHFRTITSHKIQVARECFKIGLYRQGLLHDMSKYAPTEFLNGCRYYQGGIQSPNNGERVVKGYSEAWMHHKGRNRHHYEYWTDYSIEAAKTGGNPVQPVRMPRRYVAEMLCDRIAASKIYKKEAYTQHHPLEYFRTGKAPSLMHPQTARELEAMLRILDERGEEECFRFVRDYYLRGYPTDGRRGKKKDRS